EERSAHQEAAPGDHRQMKNSMNRATLVAIAAAALSAIASRLPAQSIASRVASSPSSGSVQFSYAARAGVCGNGRSWYSIGGNSFYGNFDSDFSRLTSEQRVGAPVRVVRDISDRTVVNIRTFVGRVQPDPTAANLVSVGTPA